MIFVKKVFPRSTLKWLLDFMLFPAELCLFCISSFHIMLSITLYASSLNFEHIPVKVELSAGIDYTLFSNNRKECDGKLCGIADATWNIKER